MLNTLLAPIKSVKARCIKRRQTRTALQMLAVSGVLRHSHVELRYGTPLFRIGTLRTKGPSSSTKQPNIASVTHRGAFAPRVPSAA